MSVLQRPCGHLTPSAACAGAKAQGPCPRERPTPHLYFRKKGRGAGPLALSRQAMLWVCASLLPIGAPA